MPWTLQGDTSVPDMYSTLRSNRGEGNFSWLPKKNYGTEAVKRDKKNKILERKMVIALSFCWYHYEYSMQRETRAQEVYSLQDQVFITVTSTTSSTLLYDQRFFCIWNFEAVASYQFGCSLHNEVPKSIIKISSLYFVAFTYFCMFNYLFSLFYLVVRWAIFSPK